MTHRVVWGLGLSDIHQTRWLSQVTHVRRPVPSNGATYHTRGWHIDNLKILRLLFVFQYLYTPGLWYYIAKRTYNFASQCCSICSINKTSKFGDGYVILHRTLLGMWLLIHVAIKVNHMLVKWAPVVIEICQGFVTSSVNQSVKVHI